MKCKPRLLKGQLHFKTLVINVEHRSRKEAPHTDILLIAEEGRWGEGAQEDLIFKCIV